MRTQTLSSARLMTRSSTTEQRASQAFPPPASATTLSGSLGDDVCLQRHILVERDPRPYLWRLDIEIRHIEGRLCGASERVAVDLGLGLPRHELRHVVQR